MKRFYSLFILALLLPISTFANSFWQRLGPTEDFAFVRKVPYNSTVISFTQNGEIYRSADNGDSWNKTNSNVGVAWGEEDNQMRFTDGNLYLINENMYRSTDDGQNWQLIFSGLPGFQFTDTDFDHNTKGELIVESENGYFYSTNEGDTWKLLDMPTLNADFFSVIKARIDDSSRIHLFIDYRQGGYFGRILIHSEDYGNTWEGSLWDFPANMFYDFDLSDNGTRYILTASELSGNSVFKWEVNDFWWEENYNTQNELKQVFAEDSCAFVQEKVTSSDYKLLRTLNNGNNWSVIVDNSNETFDYIYDDGIILKGTSFDRTISLDKGENFFALNEAPLNTFSFFLTDLGIFKRGQTANELLILGLNSNDWQEHQRFTDFILKNGKLTFGQYQYTGDDDFEGDGYWIIDPDLENYSISHPDSNYYITNQFDLNGSIYIGLFKFGVSGNPYVYQVSNDKVFSVTQSSSIPIDNVVDEMTTKMDGSGNVLTVVIQRAENENDVKPFRYTSNLPPPFDSVSGGEWQADDIWWYNELWRSRYNYHFVGSDTVYASCISDCQFGLREFGDATIRLKNGNQNRNVINPITKDPIEISSLFGIIAAEEPVADRFFFYDNVPGYGTNIFEVIDTQISRIIPLKTNDNSSFGAPRAIDVLDGRLFVATTSGMFVSNGKVNLPKLTMNVSGGNVSVEAGDTVKFKISVGSSLGGVPGDVSLKVFNTIDSTESTISIDGAGKAEYNYLVNELQEHGDFTFTFTASSPSHQFVEPIDKYVNVADFSSDRYFTHEAFGSFIRFDAGEGNKFIEVDGNLQLGQQQEIRINDFLLFDGTVSISPTNLTFSGNGTLYLQGAKIPGNPFTDDFILAQGEFLFDFSNPFEIKIPKQFEEAFKNATKVFGAFLEIVEFEFVYNDEINKFDAVQFDASINIPGVSGSCGDDAEPKLALSGINLSTVGIDFGEASISDVGVVPSVCINELSFSYDAEADTLNILGDFSAPFIEQIIAEFGLVGGNINAISLGVTVATPIPIPGTPLGLKGLYGSVSGLALPPLVVGLGGTIASVKEGLFEIELYGEVEIPNRIAFDATGRFIQIPGDENWQIVANIGGEFDIRSHINIYGSVNAITIGGSDYFISGAADFAYVWAPEESISGSINGNIKIPEVPDWKGNVVYDMVASVVGLPYNLASASFAFENERVGGSFSTQVPVFGTFEMFFTADLEKDFPECCELGLGATNINEFVNQGTPPIANLDGLGDKPILLKIPSIQNQTRQDTIPASDDMRMIIVRIKSDDTFPDSKLIDPDGNVFNGTNQDTTIAYHENSSDSTGFWLIKSPKAGDWILEFTNSTEADSIDVFAFYKEKIKDITITQSQQNITLTWDTTNSSSDAEYGFFIDDDSTGYDGIFLGNTPEKIGQDLISLGDNLNSCQYYIYVVKNNNNLITRRYLDTLISFNKSGIQSPNRLFLSAAIDTNDVVINWEKSVSQNIAGYKLVKVLGNIDGTSDSTYAYLNPADTSYTISTIGNIGKDFYVQAYNDSADISCPSPMIEVQKVVGTNLDINLNTGWNMISSYLEPSDNNIETIFENIEDDILLVKNSSGQIYAPAFGINDIQTWNEKQGYQVYATANTILSIDGNPISPENTPIELNAGWAIVTNLNSNTESTANAFATLIDRNSLLLAKNNLGQIYAPDFGIDDIINLNPTEGYQVYLTQKDTLIYPANSNGEKAGIYNENDFVRPKKLISVVESSSSNMTLLIDDDIDNGTEIAVYDSEGIIVGSAVFKSGKAGLTIWSDDKQTEAKDGAVLGEELTIKILNDGNLIDYEAEFLNLLEKSINETLTYKDGSIIIPKKTNSQLTGSTINISPQPAYDILNVEMLLPSTERTINIYDASGKLINTINTSNNNIDINIENLPAGVYYINIISEEGTIRDKFVTIK